MKLLQANIKKVEDKASNNKILNCHSLIYKK